MNRVECYMCDNEFDLDESERCPYCGAKYNGFRDTIKNYKQSVVCTACNSRFDRDETDCCPYCFTRYKLFDDELNESDETI